MNHHSPVPLRNTLFFSLFCSLFALSVNACKKTEPQAPTTNVRPVKVFKINNRGAIKTVEYPGQIHAVQKSWKAFEVSGRVIKRFVKEGDIVKKGQVLIKLDPRDYQYAYDAAVAQYKAASAVQKRTLELRKKQAISQQKLDLAERDLRQAQAQLQKAKKALNDTQLVADFDGRIAKMLVDDFANVVAKQNVLMIQNNKLLEIAINIPESAVVIPLEGKSVAEKVKATHPIVLFSVLPGEQYPATYREASEEPDPATRTYEVKLTFLPKKNSLVRPGMTAKVRAFIPANTASKTIGFSIPLCAILSKKKGNSYVWKIDPKTHRVSKISVNPGALIKENCIVQGNLKNRDLIAVSGVHELREGDQVSIWNASAQ